jgi:hypothetical protein
MLGSRGKNWSRGEVRLLSNSRLSVSSDLLSRRSLKRLWKGKWKGLCLEVLGVINSKFYMKMLKGERRDKTRSTAPVLNRNALSSQTHSIRSIIIRGWQMHRIGILISSMGVGRGSRISHR